MLYCSERRVGIARRAGWLGGWVAGWLGRWVAGSLGGWVAGSLGGWVLGRWVAGSLGRWVAGWPGRWVAGWLGRWVAGWLGLGVGGWVAGCCVGGRWVAGSLGGWVAGWWLWGWLAGCGPPPATQRHGHPATKRQPGCAAFTPAALAASVLRSVQEAQWCSRRVAGKDLLDLLTKVSVHQFAEHVAKVGRYRQIAPL